MDELMRLVEWLCDDIDAACAEVKTGGQQVSPRMPLGGLQPSAKVELRRRGTALREALGKARAEALDRSSWQ